MPKLKNLTGEKFSKLTVVERAENLGRKVQWLCKCECGNTTIATAVSLTLGEKKSCGCIRYRYDNLSKTRLYRIWFDMKRRCADTRREDYKYYGNRGVSVCEEWLNDFMSFYNWSMHNEYKEGLSIDRVDVDKNYEPGNCRWITMDEQKANKTNTVKVLVDGREWTAREIAKATGLKESTVRDRVRKGWSAEEIMRPIND